jgi:hypothetical protein
LQRRAAVVAADGVKKRNGHKNLDPRKSWNTKGPHLSYSFYHYAYKSATYSP